MTPKDKAKELINKYKPIVYSIDSFSDYDENIALVNAKSCAFIAVDEIISVIDEHIKVYLDTDWKRFWEQVKKEIINL